MNKLFKKPRIQGSKSYNGFDLSQRRIFRMPTGMLLPLFTDLANPFDQYVLNSDTFIRTEAVETAAFTQLRYIVDWHFVPMQQIYMFWNEFYNQTQNLDTSLVAGSGKFAFPKHDILKTIKSVFESGADNPFGTSNSTRLVSSVDQFGVPKVHSFRRLFDMFDMGSLTTTKFDFHTGDTQVSYSLLLPYLAYHKVFYSHYNNSQFFLNDPSLYNVDNKHGGIVGETDTYRIMSTIHYRPYNIDYFTNIQPAPTFNNQFVNSAFDNRVFDQPIDFDNFDASVLFEHSNDTTSRLFLNQTSYNSTTPTTEGINTPPGVVANTKVGESLNLRANDIRTLFAFDKLYRITASTGSSYEDQTLAHFGVSVPKGIGHESYFIGSQVTDININEVVATATTDSEGAGSTIGDIAGKGFGSTRPDKDIKFTAPCHGVLIGICSVVPKPMYASRVGDPTTRYLDTFDFFHPEIDNVGMVPMFNSAAYFNYIGTKNSQHLDGWTYRYSELKTKYDKINESIWDTDKASWATYKQSLYGDVVDTDLYPNLHAIFYCAPQYTNTIFLQEFPYYEYSESKGIVVNFATDKDWNSGKLTSQYTYAGDPFIVNSFVKCYKSSQMSVHSLPKLY
ncbi:major capsid protein [Peromfec virus RodF8_12]|uniref:Major capsid protein n=1 Tax=Peromfec virus RodF8_12 TaxID=2929358 RepID=A0A976R8T8_9VIRU|nr:major capsid protein [Peromfec virus RodF8_12]